MLKKLLKYDLQRIYKFLITFYILSIFFSITTRIFLSIDNSTIMYIIGKISSGLTIVIFISTIVFNIMKLWSNFINNLYKDEAYLTHTIPVKKKHLYLSKLLTSIITIITSIIVIAVSLGIAYYSKENIELIKLQLTMTSTINNSNIISLLLIVFLVFTLEIIFLIESGYNGIILGHKKNNNKIILSVIYSFLSYMACQIITLLIIFIISLFNQDLMNLFTSNIIPSISTIKSIMYLAITIYLLYIMLYYLINVKLLNQGVNID